MRGKRNSKQGKLVNLSTFFLLFIFVIISINALESSEESPDALVENVEVQDTGKLLSPSEDVEVLVEKSIIPEEAYLMEELPLANVVNNKPIRDDSYIKGYLKKMNYFENTPFERVETVTEKQFIMRGGIVREFKGIVINDEKYVIHLVYCDREQQACIFRINGILTGILREGEKYDLTLDYFMKIDTIDFDFCDNRRFCDYYFEAYDKVELEIINNNLVKPLEEA